MSDYTKMNTNELIEARAAVTASIRASNAVTKEFQVQQDDIDSLLMAKMDSEGTKRTANEMASVSISETVVPNVVDWDAFHAYVKDTSNFSLLHRKVTAAAYRELLELGQMPPGTEPVTVRKINFRSL